MFAVIIVGGWMYGSHSLTVCREDGECERMRLHKYKWLQTTMQIVNMMIVHPSSILAIFFIHNKIYVAWYAWYGGQSVMYLSCILKHRWNLKYVKNKAYSIDRAYVLVKKHLPS